MNVWNRIKDAWWRYYDWSTDYTHDIVIVERMHDILGTRKIYASVLLVCVLGILSYCTYPLPVRGFFTGLFLFSIGVWCFVTLDYYKKAEAELILEGRIEE